LVAIDNREPPGCRPQRRGREQTSDARADGQNPAVGLLLEAGGARGSALLLDVALVVLLRLPECLRGDDLGDDRFAQLLLVLGERRTGLGDLIGIVDVDRRAVLAADVRALPIARRRIVDRPESA
jgi:hypothetical protein